MITKNESVVFQNIKVMKNVWFVLSSRVRCGGGSGEWSPRPRGGS